MTNLTYLESRISREIENRKLAERLLDAKSRELHQKNLTLESAIADFREAADLMAATINAVPDAIISCDEQHIIESANEGCFTMLGYQPSEMIGCRIDAFLKGLSLELDDKTDPSLTGLTVKHKDGRELTVELRGRRAFAKNRKIFVFILRDISANQTTETLRDDLMTQLHESRRLEAIGTLSSGVAHELNTPVQYIGDNIKFVSQSLEKIHQSYLRYHELKKICEKENLHIDIVEIINEYNRSIDLKFLIKDIFSAMQESLEGIAQIRDITSIMKEFSHPGTKKFEEINLNLLVHKAQTISRSRYKGIASIETDLQADLPLVTCRPSQIQQVLINLIINAAQAIEEHNPGRGKICIRTHFAEGVCRLEVRDNGPGVKDSLREKIFDPFFTTKSVGKGTGQGLALAKDIIVNQHHGKLYLADRPGFATTFVIELPMENVAITPMQQTVNYAQT